MSQYPLCFIIMPFGQKPDPTGRGTIDFDRIYHEALEPAITASEMEPVRADTERTGGIIHKPMFERLLLCDYAIADLTTANANVFYELGVRHAARPATTLTIFAKHQPIPFDVNFLRSMPYDLGAHNAFGDNEAQVLREAVMQKLRDLHTLTVQQAPIDSPLFQLLAGWQPDIAHVKTDVFRDRVQANEAFKRQLAMIRDKGKSKDTRAEAHEEIESLLEKLGPLDAVEAATIVDLMLSYRAIEDWDGMINVYHHMHEVLKRQSLVREQLGFAYNRRAGATQSDTDRAEALRILTEVDSQQGPSSETLSLIGRIHKDQWKAANEAKDNISAMGYLKQAIDAYRRGYLADQRDAYPGINLLTLLDIQGKTESIEERNRLLPVVRFAVEQRLSGSTPDYWDHATRLELAVLQEDSEQALERAGDALAAVRETWEASTTANNLRMIEAARKERGMDTSWLEEIVQDLEKQGA